MSCSETSDCGYRLTVLNEYAVLIDTSVLEPAPVSLFWLYDSFVAEDKLEDKMLVDDIKVAWDSPEATVFVSCAFDTTCNSNFELADGACYVSSDYDIVDVNNG